MKKRDEYARAERNESLRGCLALLALIMLMIAVGFLATVISKIV